MISQTSFYSSHELQKLGFKKLGSNILISRFARFYNPEDIEMGSNVRIDDFCLLSGNIVLGSFIHISAYSALYGKFGIELEDFTGLSPRCTLFSASDDFSGDFMISPMAPKEFTKILGGKITLKKFAQVGSGTIIMPDVTINDGCAVGALSLVKSDLEAWSIYAGNPIRFIKKREKGLLKFHERISERK
jgi:acetyltransferase-like isoleucine patch superfamily enzyme